MFCIFLKDVTPTSSEVFDVAPRDGYVPSASPSSPMAFARARHGAFYQTAPRLGNQWLDDPILSPFFRRHVPSSCYDEIASEMRTFGDRVAGDLLETHLRCEADPPRLRRYDAWGNRVDRLITGEAWKRMKSVSASEGLIAIAYERKYARWSRLFQVGQKEKGMIHTLRVR